MTKGQLKHKHHHQTLVFWGSVMLLASVAIAALSIAIAALASAAPG